VVARATLVAGAVSGGLAVAAGAFGAHALAGALPADRLATFETGARYQMFHALVLVALAFRSPSFATRHVTAVAALFAAGTVLFSGSLYAFALTGVRAWGAVTPVGGVCWLAGWGLLAVAALRAGR